MDQQLDWMLTNGGLEWAAARSEKSAQHIYNWAQNHELMTQFVPNPADRSTVVTTIDVAEVVASEISKTLREHSIVDIDGYRGLGRNQLRIATFPTIDPEDVAKLTDCIDFVVDKLR
jgi:phosphoserine aminotransferase